MPIGKWISRQLGTQSLNQDFGYNAQGADYAMSGPLEGAMGSLSSMAGDMRSQGMDMLSGTGAWYDQQRRTMEGQTMSAAERQSQQVGSQMAARGMGGGGLRSLLDASINSNAMESLRAGESALATQGMTMGSAMMGQAIGAQSQVGGLAAGAEGRGLQAQMFSAEQSNQQQQFKQTAQYNQAAGNRAAKGSFVNSLLGAVGTGAGLALSDRNIKENIDLVGVSDSGINIYEFDYKDKSNGEGRYRGVMAQEVPEASVMGTNGRLLVDYSRVDVEFERIA